MLRRRTLHFLACIACGLLVLPVLNFAAAVGGGAPVPRTFATLFGTDAHVAPWLNGIAVRAGISSSPHDVVVGREGWLYLGDRHGRTRTASRRGQTAQDEERAARIGAAAQAWEAWMRKRGVRLYRVLLGPNKGSVYPELAPRWAQPAAPAPVEALLARAAKWYVDPRPALLQARQGAAAPLLYYRTDTHWTELGAAVAFQAFAQAVAADAPELRWPGPGLLALREVATRPGGDLAGFLRLTGTLQDREPSTGLAAAGIETVHYDADGHVVHSGGNPAVAVGKRPTRVVSKGALNPHKVLWVRDSFGGALSPFMAATFAETLQVHYDQALRPGPHELARLVETWRPDYVFVTVVERAAGSSLFTVLPPADDLPKADSGKQAPPR